MDKFILAIERFILWYDLTIRLSHMIYEHMYYMPDTCGRMALQRCKEQAFFLGYLTPGDGARGAAMLPAGASLIVQIEGKCSLDLPFDDRTTQHFCNTFFSVVVL